MNEDIFSGKWHQLKGKVKEKWGKLTDDDLTRINGKREQLLGSLEEKYGWEKHRAEEELKRFEDNCRSCCSKEKESCGCDKGKCTCNKDHKGCCGHDHKNDWDDKSKKRKIG